ncbi:hypothetical protein GIX45_27510 [Erwinia sp. CPCC 100877]|nr:hypothetical protein [Erwinia sp. CPCC 100877]
MIFLIITVIIVVLVYGALNNKNKREDKIVKKSMPVKRMSLDERLQLEKKENLVKLHTALTQVEKRTVKQLTRVINNLKETKL